MRITTILMAAFLTVCCGGPVGRKAMVGLWVGSEMAMHSVVLSLAADGSFDCIERQLVQTKPAPDLYRHGTWVIDGGNVRLRAVKLAAVYDSVGFRFRIEKRNETAELPIGDDGKSMTAHLPMWLPTGPNSKDFLLTRQSANPKPVDWAALERKYKGQ